MLQAFKSTAMLAMLAIVICALPSCNSQKPTETTSGAAAACTLPSAMAATSEQTAWQLFVAANCPANGKLTWETWTEQTCFADPSSPGCSPGAALTAVSPLHHLHGSRLAGRLGRPAPQAALAGAAPGGCSPMTTSSNAGQALMPFVPPNLASGAQFCEEVFADPSEASFVKVPTTNATLTNLGGQVAYAASTAITFPTPAVEIKADWLPAASLSTPFDCANPPVGVYTESISGACYALVGIHVSSKLLPNWLWATFEPQNSVTNPNRCNPDLYNSCNDPWGSNPAASTGTATAQTAALTNLMTHAGLPKPFLNYRLVAAQSAYLNPASPDQSPVQLGNSFVEFNAGVLPHQASCMTCHSYAMVSTVAQENPNFGNFPGTPPIGNPGAAPLPAQGGGTWVAQDFSWMLGIMPAAPPAHK